MHTHLLSPDLRGVRLPTDRPLRILFLTSVRDTGECDRNGTIVHTDGGAEYMMGAIEYAAWATRPNGPLHGLYTIAGVITDDRMCDLRDYATQPISQTDHQWLWPRELDLPTWNIPSDFRGLPRAATMERIAGKLAFETRVYELFQELDADIIVSDHYMAKIEHLIMQFRLYGRVLNIHPAVTVVGHPFCFRGPTPTKDAIAQAQSGIPTVTGATLHLVNHMIDDGPIIAFTDGTPVYGTDEPQWLRWRNYLLAKCPLMVEGLRHYRQLVSGS